MTGCKSAPVNKYVSNQAPVFFSSLFDSFAELGVEQRLLYSFSSPFAHLLQRALSQFRDGLLEFGANYMVNLAAADLRGRFSGLIT